MKTAEDFRRSLGVADAAFEQLVRRTLTELEYEEVRPVKKKISMGFALAAALVLLAVTALAAGSWGIVNYLQEKGQEPPVFKLVRDIPQQQGFSRLADVSIDEVLIDGGKVYLAMTVQPKTEKTLVIPKVENLAVPGGMAVLNNPEYDAAMSVRDFAKSRGFENIVGVTLEESEIFKGLNNASYQVLEEGTLRCLLEYSYAGGKSFPEERIWMFLNVLLLNYRGDDTGVNHVVISDEEWFQVQVELPLNIRQETKRSQAADAHDIVGYKGFIEHITMTPMEDGSVQYTMLMDMNDEEETVIRFPTATLLDENGQQVFWLNGRRYNMGISNKQLFECTIPAEHAAVALADKVTIQFQELTGEEPLNRDTYTYTME